MQERNRTSNNELGNIVISQKKHRPDCAPGKSLEHTMRPEADMQQSQLQSIATSNQVSKSDLRSFIAIVIVRSENESESFGELGWVGLGKQGHRHLTSGSAAGEKNVSLSRSATAATAASTVVAF